MSILAPSSTCAAVTLPFRIHSPAKLSAAPWGATNWRCAAVLIDMHIVKNGGTTFRKLLWHNERLGQCTYLGISDPLSAQKEQIHLALRNDSRVCIEHHNGNHHRFWGQVAALREVPLAALAAGGCAGIRVVMRIREPFAWYVSWYLWGAGHNGRQRLNATTLPANLQSRIILGTSRGSLMRWKGTSSCGRCGPLTSVEHAKLTQYLSLVDILAPMDCYDEMVVLLTQVVGSWVATRFTAENVNNHMTADRANIGGPLDLRSASDLCAPEDDPLLPRCRELVRSLAADDVWLYRTATRRFSRQLQQAEASPAWAAKMAKVNIMRRWQRRGGSRKRVRKSG